MPSVRLPVIQPDDFASGALPSDGRRTAIQPADVRGRFATGRRAVQVLLIGLWVALPWAKIAGHPAVFLDVDSRQFFLFGAAFNAQDTWLLLFLLTGVGFGPVYATALARRVWCGWACPQTVFLEGVFRRIERLVERPREKRIQRNAGPWNADRVLRKALAHALHLVATFVVAHVFLSYFVSLPKALQMIPQEPCRVPRRPFAWAFTMTAAF